MAINGPLKCRKLAFSIVGGRAGIEIGGPSAVFREQWFLPIYDKVGSLDNCDFRRENVWASHQKSYRFNERKPAGKTYFSEGSNLKDIADGKYDFVLSSHNLEHIANPVKALKEWQRVLKPGGYLLIVLPYYRWTFDRKRSPTTVKHMLEDYDRHAGEDDLTHVDEVCATRWEKSAESDAKFRARLLDNVHHRTMHHHVFDAKNSRELLEASGIKVLAAELYPPIHIFLVVQASSSEKPSSQPRFVEG